MRDIWIYCYYCKVIFCGFFESVKIFRDLEKELVCYVKTIIFTDSFVGGHSFINKTCYNNLFLIMQHDNF